MSSSTPHPDGEYPDPSPRTASASRVAWPGGTWPEGPGRRRSRLAEGLTRRATARPGQAPLITLASPFANQGTLLGVLSALLDRDVQLRSVEWLEAESVADVPVEDS